MVFFSTDGQGLTSTSANHIANLAKEKIRNVESSLDTLTLFSTSVSLIGTGTENRLTTGISADELGEVIGKLRTIAKAKSLIAWLREAIKAERELREAIKRITMEEFLKIKGIEEPEFPKSQKVLTEEDFYNSLSVDERNRYFEAETLAAVLGKAIHQEGSLAKAREELQKRILSPRSVEGEGRDALIYSYTPTVAQADIEDLYFRIQKQYREAQAKVNSVKHECEKAVSESEIASTAQFRKDLNDYNQARSLLEAELVEYKKEQLAKIRKYRIIIPQSLKEIYEEVSSLGKSPK